MPLGRELRALLVSLPLAGAWACGNTPTGPIEITDPSVTARVKPGEEVLFRLESNPSTGFSWRLARPVDQSVLVFVESKYAPPSGAAPGQSGSESLRFRAVGHGQATIDLEYGRLWESEAPVRTASFSVLVN